jgi:hypothetical protein
MAAGFTSDTFSFAYKYPNECIHVFLTNIFVKQSNIIWSVGTKTVQNAKIYCETPDGGTPAMDTAAHLIAIGY